MSRIERGQFAVFTRNHRVHLAEAAALCAADPTRLVTFRASVTWVSAERAVASGSPIPIYVAVVGGPGAVEYVAELCDVQLRPHRGDPKTERLLRHWTNSTKDEGLWEKYDKPVRTLYVIRKCKALRRSFPISNLVKASDGTSLSAEFRYSYAMVVPVPSLSV